MGYYRYEGHLNPLPPYEFEYSRRFIRQRHIGDVQTDIDHTLIFPITFADHCLIITLTSRGKVESPLLMTTVTSPMTLSDRHLEQLQTSIRFFLSLDDSIQPLYSLGWDDDPFADILDDWYGYHQVKFTATIAAACFALFAQDCGLETAALLWQLLLNNFGPELTFTDKVWHSFPSASSIANLEQGLLVQVLEDVGLTGRLQQLARAFATKEKQSPLADQPDTRQLFTWLNEHTPLNNESIQFVLLKGFGCYDQLIMPLENMMDLAQTIYGAEIPLQKLQGLANHYKNYQGYWYLYLQLNELK